MLPPHCVCCMSTASLWISAGTYSFHFQMFPLFGNRTVLLWSQHRYFSAIPATGSLVQAVVSKARRQALCLRACVLGYLSGIWYWFHYVSLLSWIWIQLEGPKTSPAPHSLGMFRHSPSNSSRILKRYNVDSFRQPLHPIWIIRKLIWFDFHPKAT